MRAVSQDTEASAMMGINVNRTISITFFIAGALAAVAGLVFLLEYNIRYDTGFELGLIAFTAAVLGGIGNLAGAVLGALLIGFIQSFNEGLLWMTPGRRLDAVARVRDPDRRPRLPAPGHPRRANAGGSVTGLAERARGIGAGQPERLARPTPDRRRAGLPLGRRLAPRSPPDRRLHPGHGVDGRDARVHDDGGRPQHRRRLRRPARPRLRRVLRRRRLHGRLVRVAAVRPGDDPLRLVGLERLARASTSRCGSSSSPPGLLTLLAGILIGLPTLRLRGDYLAIVTLGFGEIIPQVVRNGDSFFGFDLTHGTFGIAPIDPVGFPVLSAVGLPENFQKSDNRELWYYLIAFLLLLITVFCSVRLRDSRLGRAWIAIREDETAAGAMGIPLMRTKTWAYAIGAFFGGVAGAYYASFKSGAFPADFYFNFSVFLLCMVILGGMGSVWGVILGGLILSYLDREGLATIGSKVQDAGLDFDPTKYQFGIYGVIIVLMMLFRPAGLIPERRHKIEIEEGVHDTPFYDVQTEGTLTDRDPSDD